MMAAPEETVDHRSDERLLAACTRGDETAWAELVDRYKNLVFSIPLKLGISREDAADIFQSIWLELLRSLGNIRDPKALPKWLIQTTTHKCFHWKRGATDLQDIAEIEEPAVPASAESALLEIQQEQAMRDALAMLSPRCQQLVQMLFFQTPPRPYQEIARELGLATGSIGFIRNRCLDRLKKELSNRGFE